MLRSLRYINSFFRSRTRHRRVSPESGRTSNPDRSLVCCSLSETPHLCPGDPCPLQTQRQPRSSSLTKGSHLPYKLQRDQLRISCTLPKHNTRDIDVCACTVGIESLYWAIPAWQLIIPQLHLSQH